MDEKYLETAVAAALRGGEVLLRFFRKLDPAKITEKSKNDLVSEADTASEQAIREILTGRYPSHSFFGEESGQSGENTKCWIIDPLDGTLNFVQGFHHWCVSVALWDDGKPLVGCIFDPLRGDLFLAESGFGSHWFQNVDTMKKFDGLRDIESACPKQSLAVSKHPGLDGAFVATGFAFQLGDKFVRYSKILESVFYRAMAIRRAGSAALDLAHTAAGIYDGYFEMGLQKWDMAAGTLLLQEAGGLITDWEGSDRWWDNGSVVAGGPNVQRQLVELTMAGGNI